MIKEAQNKGFIEFLRVRVHDHHGGEQDSSRQGAGAAAETSHLETQLWVRDWEWQDLLRPQSLPTPVTGALQQGHTSNPSLKISQMGNKHLETYDPVGDILIQITSWFLLFP